MKDDSGIQFHVGLHRLDEREAAQVAQVNFSCILARSAPSLLLTCVEKLEIGITSQFTDDVQLQIHRSRDKTFFGIGS